MSGFFKPGMVVVCSFIGLLLPISPASAGPQVSFSVSPDTIDRTIAVGDETRETVTLHNLSTVEIVVKAHSGPRDSEEAPGISLEPGQISLKPGESAPVIIRVAIPDNAQPGRQLSSVSFEAASSAGRDVAIVGQVGVALDTQIIRPVADVNWSFPRIIDSTDQAVIGMEGRNAGNFTTRLEGKAKITGIFGDDISLIAVSAPVKVGESVFLQAVWDETPTFSMKRATLDLSSGIGAPVEKKATLMIFPWKLSLMLILIAAVAVAGARYQPRIANVFSSNGRRAG